jgi:hypothetical protein
LAPTPCANRAQRHAGIARGAHRGLELGSSGLAVIGLVVVLWCMVTVIGLLVWFATRPTKCPNPSATATRTGRRRLAQMAYSGFGSDDNHVIRRAVATLSCRVSP